MSDNKEELGSSIELHKIQTTRIDRIRDRAEELMQADLGLKSDVRDIATKLERLTERLDQGVSKTAFKTFEKVTEMAAAFEKFRTEIVHDNEKRDMRIGRSEQLWNWFIRGVLFVVVAGTLMSVWKFKA